MKTISDMLKKAFAAHILTENASALEYLRVDSDRFFESDSLHLLESGFYERLRVTKYVYSLTYDGKRAVVTRTA